MRMKLLYFKVESKLLCRQNEAFIPQSGKQTVVQIECNFYTSKWKANCCADIMELLYLKVESKLLCRQNAAFIPQSGK